MRSCGPWWMGLGAYRSWITAWRSFYVAQKRHLRSSSMLSRKAKIRALLDSSLEGERQAAAAALERTTVAVPPPGTPEFDRQMIAWAKLVDECRAHLGDPRLTPEETATLRRWTRSIGYPWEDAADQLRAIHRK